MAAAAGVTGLTGIEDMALAFSPAAYGVRRSGRPRSEGPRSRMKIGSFETTLVASPDYALLNSWNVHDTHFKRAILELETTDGYTGVAEVGGAALQPSRRRGRPYWDEIPSRSNLFAGASLTARNSRRG